MTGNSIVDFLFSFVFLIIISCMMFSIRDIKRMEEEHFKIPTEQKEGL